MEGNLFGTKADTTSTPGGTLFGAPAASPSFSFGDAAPGGGFNFGGGASPSALSGKAGPTAATKSVTPAAPVFDPNAAKNMFGSPTALFGASKGVPEVKGSEGSGAGKGTSSGALLDSEADAGKDSVQAGVVVGGMQREEHTWTEAGPLGLKLKQRGSTKDSKAGVSVGDVTKDSVPNVLKGMVLEEINGTGVSQMSYNEVLGLIKGAGRPLSIKFRGTVAKTDSVAPVAKPVGPPKPTLDADGNVIAPGAAGAASASPMAPPLPNDAPSSAPSFIFGGGNGVTVKGQRYC